MKPTSRNSTLSLSRRDVFLAGTAVTAASFLATTALRAARLPQRGAGPNIYERIGLKPFINCTSDRTINGGAEALPEVVEAIREASYYHVNLEELMAAAGPRIAGLLEVEGAMKKIGGQMVY